MRYFFGVRWFSALSCSVQGGRTEDHSWTLAQFIELVLQFCEFPFTVGEDERDTTPKPMLWSPSVPVVIPMSKALPIWGMALWCVWAAHTTKTSELAAEPPKAAETTLLWLHLVSSLLWLCWTPHSPQLHHGPPDPQCRLGFTALWPELVRSHWV